MAKRIRFKQTKPWISYANGEMSQMVNDKCQHNQAAHHHVPRGERGFHVLSVDVGVRPRAPIFDCQLDGHVNVSDNSGEQENTDQPQERSEIAQMLRVTVDPVRAEENLKVAEQMSDDKKDQNDAGNRDDHFLPNRRAIKGR